MARPKKKPGNKFTKQLPPVRCTESEYAAIQAHAAQANMTITEFIRQMSLKGKVTVKESRYDFALIDQFRRIGININQQTRIANATGEFPPELRRLWRMLDSLLDEIISTG